MSFFNKKNDVKTAVTVEPILRVSPTPKKINSILKGSRLKGDILVTCDLELSGEILGNITARDSSSVCIKGSCRGNIETLSGNVQVEGEMIEGNISAGGDVHITGKFVGGSVVAGGKCYVDGEFSGKIEATDIEIGSNAKLNGELNYREGLSVLKGAKVSGALNQLEAVHSAELLIPSLAVG
jgi:hypothetical protein